MAFFPLLSPKPKVAQPQDGDRPSRAFKEGLPARPTWCFQRKRPTDSWKGSGDAIRAQVTQRLLPGARPGRSPAGMGSPVAVTASEERVPRSLGKRVCLSAASGKARKEIWKSGGQIIFGAF